MLSNCSVFSSGLSPRERYLYPNPTLTFGIPSTDANAPCLQISNNTNGHLIRNQTRGSSPTTSNSFANCHALPLDTWSEWYLESHSPSRAKPNHSTSSSWFSAANAPQWN